MDDIQTYLLNMRNVDPRLLERGTRPIASDLPYSFLVCTDSNSPYIVSLRIVYPFATGENVPKYTEVIRIDGVEVSIGINSRRIFGISFGVPDGANGHFGNELLDILSGVFEKLSQSLSPGLQTSYKIIESGLGIPNRDVLPEWLQDVLNSKGR